jgi:hypothetical protein
MESQLSMIDLIGISFSISKESDIFLSQTKLLTKLANSEIISAYVKNNIIINLVQLNCAFYNLASSTSPIEQNHADLFNFVYNSRNNYDLAIKLLIDTYIKELDLKTKSYKFKMELQLLIYFVLYFSGYLVTMKIYSKAIKRKKTYMSVFFDLDFEFIINSINKCDEFNNKFSLSEEYNNKEEGDISTNYDKNDNVINNTEKKYRESFNFRRKIIKGDKKNKKKFECTKHFIVKIIIGIFILTIFVFYHLFGYYYLLNLNQVVNNKTNFYYHLQNYHINIIEYFNLYREYIFDNESLILNRNPYDNLVLQGKKIYSNWTNDINNISYYQKTLIEDNDLRKQLNKKLCSYNYTDIFKNEEDCNKTIGNGHDQDINIFISCFVDEIRIKKNKIRLLTEEGKIIGNLAEYKTDQWYNEYHDLLNNQNNEDIDEKMRFRLDLFNDRYFHTISNIYFINIILPCINEQRKIVFNSISIDGRQNIYYILISIFVFVLSIIYIFYWTPAIKRLNRVIFETKKMLKIIPMHILMSDLNIKNLLHISYKK